MRKIKFRAWDKNQKTLLSHETLDNYDRDGILHLFDIIKNQKKEGVYLMQYTGLKDKNGKEIYDGDIVHTNSKYKNKTDWTGIVKWSNEHCGFIVELENGKHWMPISEAEVIGNIYENPELLKQTT